MRPMPGPMPGPMRALMPLAVVRCVVLVLGYVRAVALSPRTAARLGDVLDAQALATVRTALVVALVVFGVAFTVVYLTVVRAVRRGNRVARIVLLAACGYLLLPTLSVLLLPAARPADRVVPPLFVLPDGLRWVVIGGSTIDVVVIVLLLLPVTRAWFARTRPPTLSRAPASAPPRWTPGPPSPAVGVTDVPEAPHLQQPPPGWAPPPDDPTNARRH